jgi:histidinol-phosphate aminotransferase
MGSYWRGEEIAAALDTLGPDVLMVLDEAYAEFAPEDAALPLAIDDERVIRMRTFSKAYGIAGARVGYAMGATGLIRSFEKIRNHFGMNRSAQIGALAALKDQEWLAEVLAQVETARTEIARIAAENGLTALPSATNFVTVDCGADGDLARAVVKALGARGVFVRMPFVAPEDRCIRISCGRAEDLAVLEQELPGALAEARAAVGVAV